MVLATLIFSKIVCPTPRAVQNGSVQWCKLLRLKLIVHNQLGKKTRYRNKNFKIYSNPINYLIYFLVNLDRHTLETQSHFLFTYNMKGPQRTTIWVN